MAKAIKKIQIAEKKDSNEQHNMKGAVNAVLNKKSGFDLNDFKKSKNLSQQVSEKPKEWIPLSPAFNKAISYPGLPHGHIVIFRGHSDTGKTTAMIEAMVSAQRMGKLVVIIVTEMKWSWEHAIEMGFKVDVHVDPDTGNISYDGFFIYVDRDNVNTIEDVAATMANLLDHQNKGELPYDLVFVWDSIGSIPCRMSVESNKNNNEWNAGAMSTQFGNFINQKIMSSRKASHKYTNSLYAVNKVWVEKPSVPMELPKLKNKNGNTMYFDASIVITFGNVTNAGTSKISAIKGGKKVDFGKRTKISVDKNHTDGVTTTGRIIATKHGFIEDDKKDIDAYKKIYSGQWLKDLGSQDSSDFDIIEEADVMENLSITRQVNLEEE